MRTRLNETVEWIIFKHGDRVYDEMKAQLEPEFGYNKRLRPMDARLDISGQIRDELYEPIALVIRESGFSLD